MFCTFENKFRVTYCLMRFRNLNVVLYNVILIYFIFLSYVNFQTIRAMELILHDKLDSMRSKHLPPIKRGGEIDIYMTSSGQQEQ